MLLRKFRLTGKDINYIIRKKCFVPSKFFSFFYVSQYPNRQFNQISFQSSLKFSKRAVKRNMLRRICYDFVNENGFSTTTIRGKYYKIFVVMNKKTIENLKESVETKNKTDISLEIKEMLNFSFRSLCKKINESG